MANINTIAGYNILNKSKIDSRFTVENASARLAFDAANMYEGLIVFQEDTDEVYVCINDTAPELEASWQLIGAGTGSSGTSGTSGSSGTTGTSGTSGTSGAAGQEGFKCFNRTFQSGNPTANSSVAFLTVFDPATNANNTNIINEIVALQLDTGDDLIPFIENVGVGGDIILKLPSAGFDGASGAKFTITEIVDGVLGAGKTVKLNYVGGGTGLLIFHLSQVCVGSVGLDGSSGSSGTSGTSGTTMPGS